MRTGTIGTATVVLTGIVVVLMPLLPDGRGPGAALLMDGDRIGVHQQGGV